MTRMDCTEVRDLLTAYLDDELPTGERHAVSEHLAQCAECPAELRGLQSLSARVRLSGTHAMPAGLEARVMAHFDDAQSPVLDFRRYRPMASHLAAAAIGAFILYGAMTHVGSTELMIRETLAVHTRAMMSEQVEQVASSDQHTVKPWFAGRLPFSPPVNDVLPAEYPLIGGRVESLNAKPAAVVVYGRRKHRIALFMQPVSASAISPMDISRDGYNMLSWRDRDFAYLAVSDLNVVEFKEFIGRLR